MLVQIVTVTNEDLPRLAAGARAFFASSRFLKGFQAERFCESWRALLASGAGVIFAAVDGAGEPIGAIGGLAYPDLCSGDAVASELFWFVRDGHRGCGLELYRAFEAWARARRCSVLRMVHLMDSMPDKLERFYKAQGFEMVEMHYAKEL